MGSKLKVASPGWIGEYISFAGNISLSVTEQNPVQSSSSWDVVSIIPALICAQLYCVKVSYTCCARTWLVWLSLSGPLALLQVLGEAFTNNVHQAYFTLRTHHILISKVGCQVAPLWNTPWGEISSPGWKILLSISDILNGETTKYQVFQCKCVTSINNKKDYICAESENERLRLYILVPEARPWGQTNQPGFLVSPDPKGFRVTSPHIWDRKRQKWKVLYISRKEVFSSNSNVGIEIKINVPDATKHILLRKWMLIFNFMQNKCIKKADDKYLCIRNYMCCDRTKITQMFLLGMGNWGI